MKLRCRNVSLAIRVCKKDCKVLLYMSIIAMSFSLHKICSVQTQEWGGKRSHAPFFDRFASCKSPCHYCSNRFTCIELNCNASVKTGIDINMTSFRGAGRTGNYFISLINAIDLAVSCKKTLEMPKTDDRSGAFVINRSYHILDFKGRRGPENIFCQNVSFPIRGDARFFWLLEKVVPDLAKDTRREYIFAKSQVFTSVNSCLQQYLGLCDSAYCSFESGHPLDTSDDNVLVLNLREGDIFRPNFSPQVHRAYGQPPLSYYLQAIYHKPWRSIIIVTQPGNAGPIRLGLSMLNATLKVPIQLQMSTWYDDLRTLLCAPALVTAKSTLVGLFDFVTRNSTTIGLFDIGFASQIYSYICWTSSRMGRDYFKISVHSYRPFLKHTNSQTEWLETLLHSSPKPEKC